MDPKDDDGGRWTDAWSAIPEAVGPIRHTLVEFAQTLGATPRAIDSIALAVSEAATNAVQHAYVDARTPGSITVTAHAVEPDGLMVLVADNGRGMTPRPDSPGIGLGLPLIAQVTESLQIRRSRRGGTEVHMRFALTG